MEGQEDERGSTFDDNSIEPLEDEDDFVGPTEELFADLTVALVEDTTSVRSLPVADPLDDLASCLRVLTFEMDLARVLMCAALTGQDEAFAIRDASFAAQDEAMAEPDALGAYADELVARTRYTLSSQESAIRIAQTLMEMIEAIKQGFRAGPQTPEALGYLEFISSLMADHLTSYFVIYFPAH